MSQSIQPPNYLANMPNPQQSFVQGLQLGQGVLGIQQEQQSQEQMKQALGELAANPTTEGIARAMIQFPSLADKLKEPLKSVTETERAGRIESVMPIYAALASGNPDVARERLLEMATAADNSGRTGEARRFRTLADTVRISPDMAMFQIGGVLASSMGPDKFFETFKGFSTLPSDVRTGRATATTQEATAGVSPEAAAADVEKKNAEIEQIRANISDKQGEIPESARTIVNQSADAVFAARLRAQNAASLAEKFEKVYSQGTLTRAGDIIGNVAGSQSASQRLRQEYERLANSETIKSLPPGTATEKEFAVIRAGFPAANAPPSAVRDFLKSLERLSRYDEAYQDARGQWAAANGQLGPARRDFTIDGIQVPRGTTFANFGRQYLGIVQDRLAAQEAEALARSRSYGRVLQDPAPSQSSPNNGRVLPETGP